MHRTRTPRPGPLLSDVHARLHSTRVHALVRPRSLAALRRALAGAAREGRPVSIGAGRHAMGGQQFGADTVHVDTRSLDRILALDTERGIVDVEAGIQWPALIAGLLERQGGRAGSWGIVQKQTGADRLCLGGALSANAHGRCLDRAPIAADVESIRLVDANGEVRECSRAREPELFSLVLGGYGLFGVLHSVRLRLTPRRKLRREVQILEAGELMPAFERRIAAGHLYGDFQFDIDPTSASFMRRGVFSCYRPVAPDTPLVADQRALRPEDWMALLRLAHVDKRAGFERYADHYLATDGQVYWSDTHQLGVYLDDYHRELDRELCAHVPATEVIGELYVPRHRLDDFLADAGTALRRTGGDVIYGTIRLIRRDVDSFLPWARDDYACVVLNLHTEHSPAGIERSARAFRALIDCALERGGSFFLTYHRFATREQVESAYPRFGEFLAKKLAYDPEERFQSDWYRHHKALLATEVAA